VAAAVVVVLTAAGCGLVSRDRPSAAASEPPGTPPGAPEAVAVDFLAAWSAGDDARAAQLTDAPALAGEALAGVRASLHPTAVAAAPQAAPGARRVPFTVTMTLGDAGVWTYESTVTVSGATDRWLVAWSPTVIHPRLTTKARLALGTTAGRPAPLTVADRHGQPLLPAAHPSLATILPLIGQFGASGAGPAPAVPVVQLVDPAGLTTPLETLSPPAGAVTAVTTPSTFDAGIQSAAQQAIGGAPGEGALVVVQPSTGHILALANNPPTRKVATHSALPPGSTFKIVVASALLAAGDSPTTPVPCPPTITVAQGRTFTNADEGEADGNATLEQDFALSCNTAFIARGLERLSPSVLLRHAAGVFGLAGNWDIGLHEPRAYWSLPDPGADRDQWAADLIGQGNLTVEPLALASVAATAVNGTFHQPVLVPGYPPARAAGGTAPSDGLRRMMRRAVTGGTATSLARLAGEVRAKTGTGDIAAGNAAWMVATRGDLAVACVVVGADGTRGNDTAGPVVAKLLQAV
jgi:hypothetical protein